MHFKVLLQFALTFATRNFKGATTRMEVDAYGSCSFLFFDYSDWNIDSDVRIIEILHAGHVGFVCRENK